jgi:hypothetical protein
MPTCAATILDERVDHDPERVAVDRGPELVTVDHAPKLAPVDHCSELVMVDHGPELPVPTKTLLIKRSLYFLVGPREGGEGRRSGMQAHVWEAGLGLGFVKMLSESGCMSQS